MWVDQAGLVFVIVVVSLLLYFINAKLEAQQDRVLAEGQKLVSDRSRH